MLVYVISSLSAMSILSETGCTLDKFPSSKHFVSWLNLVPNNKISGGEIISSKVERKRNKVGQIFRMAAGTLKSSKHPLGEYFRRIQARHGYSRACVTVAHKPAKIFYCTVINKQEFSMEKVAKKSKENLIRLVNKAKNKLKSLETQLESLADNQSYRCDVI